MELELSKIISKKYRINFPNELIKLILSFDLEISFDVFLETKFDLEMAIRLSVPSFYDDILNLFRKDYYKHCDDCNLQFKIKDRKKLKKNFNEWMKTQFNNYY